MLWSDYPKAPESLGQNFSYRDWYQGLNENQRVYISEVYRRHADPKLLSVAISTLIREDETNEPVGMIVSQIGLEEITDLLKQVDIGKEGYVFLLDHMSSVAAHPLVDLQAREYREYADLAPIKTALSRNMDEFEYTDPLTNEIVLAKAIPCEVLDNRWVVVAQQPREDAHRPMDILKYQIAGAGILLLLGLVGVSSVVSRYYNRAQSLNATLARVNEELSQENRERHKAEKALHQMNEKLEERVVERTRELHDMQEQLLQAQKMEAVGRLAGGVAHDFNNLLTVIIGYCSLIMAKSSGELQFHKEIEEINKAGVRAASLTRQLLAFSRKQVLQPEVINLNQIITGMKLMLQRIIGEDIDLITNVAEEIDSVEADSGLVEQIIMNLVVNARDAMPKGGKLTIETANVELDEEYARLHTDSQTGPHVMIAITDTGIGMDDKTIAKIFEPFFTTKKHGGGTGLGLSTVYGIVKQSGGSIRVYSEPGQGTTFKIYLPRATDKTTIAATRKDKIAPIGGNEAILVVEDEEGVRKLVKRVLQENGYHILSAGSAYDAIELSERHNGTIDLLLTDVVMPNMGGRELAEKLTARRREMKVVYMSGYTDNTIVHHGVLDPGTAFIEKPISPDELLRKLREYLSA